MRMKIWTMTYFYFYCILPCSHIYISEMKLVFWTCVSESIIADVGIPRLHHTYRHITSQYHHAAVDVICALPSPVNLLFHVRGQTTDIAVFLFTSHSCQTVCQPTSVCWTFHSQYSRNHWKCSCCNITVIVRRLTWRICCIAKFAPHKCTIPSYRIVCFKVKPHFQTFGNLILVHNLLCQLQPTTTTTASRGIPATARLSCLTF